MKQPDVQALPSSPGEMISDPKENSEHVPHKKQKKQQKAQEENLQDLAQTKQQSATGHLNQQPVAHQQGIHPFAKGPGKKPPKPFTGNQVH